MSETPSKSFGSTFRQLCKDLKDISDMTSSSHIMEMQKDSEYRQHIRDLESRIIGAVIAIEAQDLFQEMHIPGSFNNEFSGQWFRFRHLPEQWATREYLWNDVDKLMDHRDWKEESKSLKKAYKTFISAEPGNTKHHPQREWVEDDCAGVYSKEATPETREFTFGGAFRKLVGDLNHMIYLIDQDNKATKIKTEWEHIQDQKKVIREAVTKLSGDELLQKMVAGLQNSHDKFMDGWKNLEKLISGWAGSSSNDDISATHVNDKKWGKDRDTLTIIDKTIHWAYPWGSRKDDEWKADYRPDPNAKPDPLHMTFGKAWNRMQLDIVHLGFLLTDSQMAKRGRNGDPEFWKAVQGFEVRIRENVPKFPDHPFFQYMFLPGTHIFHGHDKERSEFMSEWKKLEELSQKWKRTSDIWNHREDFIDTRHWKRDAQILNELRKKLHDVEPRGFEHDPERQKNFLPVSEMRKDVEFTVDDEYCP